MITKWKAGEIVRDKKTGRAYMVLHVYQHVCTIVADPKQREPLAIVLLERDYDNFARDVDMQQIENGKKKLDWSFHPIDYAAD